MPVLINAESGLAENLDANVANQAVQQGTHEVPIISPEGVQGTTSIDAVSDLLKEGYTQPNSEQLKEMLDYAKYSSTGEQVKTGLESAAAAATFGGSREIERLLLDNAEEQRKRAEVNPKVAIAGELAGLGASALAGYGAAPVMEAMGAKAAASLIAGSGTAAKIGSTVVKAAVENAMYQAGSEAGKMFMNDPHQSASSAAADIGMSALIGAGVGGAIGGIGAAWNKTGVSAANSAISHIEDATLGTAGRLEKNIKFQNEIDNLPATFGRSIEDVQVLKDKSMHQAGNEIKESLLNTIKETKAPISAEFERISSKFEKQALSKADKADIADALGDQLLKEGYSKMPNFAGAKLFNETMDHMPLQESVEDLRKYVQKIGEEHVPNSATYMAAKNIRSTINEAINSVIEKRVRVNAPELIDSFVTAKANYSSMARTVEDLADRLSIRQGRSVSQTIKNIAEIDGEAMFKKASIKGDVELQNLLAREFPEVAESVAKHELDNVLKSSLDGDALDYKKLQSNINKLSPELREKIIPKEVITKLDEIKNIAEQLGTRSKGLEQAEKMLETMSPANLALVAKMTDKSFMATFAQSLFSQKLVGKNPEAVKMAIMKYLESGKELNPTALNSMIAYTNAIVKGENKIIQGVSKIFDNSSKVAIKEVVNTARLKEQISEVSNNPEKLFEMGQGLESHMPEHAAALGETTGRVVQYLNSIKPSTAPLGPLNKERMPSKTEEAAYNRALEIAEQPSIVLNKIKDGTLTMQDIQHLQAMYPSAYINYQNKLNSELLNSVHKGVILPYKTKLALSMFNGQPLDASMQPASILANQSMNQIMQQQKATPARADKLSKMPSSFMTPSQRRESDKSSGQ